jgi:hypothetical protein
MFFHDAYLLIIFINAYLSKQIFRIFLGKNIIARNFAKQVTS